jgi:hypothetical protein
VSNAQDAERLDELARELHALGSETATERTVKRTVPWVFSLAMHAGIFVVALVVAGTVRLIQRQEQPPLIVADFNAMAYEPVARLDLPQAPIDRPRTQDRVQEIDAMDEVLQERLLQAPVDPVSLISSGASSSPLARFAPTPSEGSATFVGLTSSNAKHVVYVIDASGSLIATLQVVLQELARSLDTLSQEQQFSIIFFQQDRALVVPPGKLLPATEAEKARALQWIRQSVIPAGNSNPVPALERALSLRPDVIFLLSDNITGAGQYEVDQRDLLKALDRLNPRDGRSGRRPTQINCIQFLDPDPLDTLALIAAEHGGRDGYKFLDRRELGLARP